MKSEKVIKPLEEIVLPFLFTPSVSVGGGVNGIKYYFPQGVASEMTYSQYEAVFNSQYGYQLEN